MTQEMIQAIGPIMIMTLPFGLVLGWLISSIEEIVLKRQTKPFLSFLVFPVEFGVFCNFLTFLLVK